MQVICINDQFTAAILAFYKVHGVITPVAEKIYTIREVVKHTTGDIAVRLEEIINPEVPIKHPILGFIMIEPTFHQNRFTTLEGLPIKHEELTELLKKPTKVKLYESCN